MVVGCLPVYEDRILLCKRAIEPRLGYWNLPAGYLENGETAEEGALREVVEEAGIEVEIIRLHCLYSIPRINQVYCFFLAQMSSPEWDIGEESLDAGLFLPEEIPYQEIAFPSSIYAINRYLESKDTGFEGAFISSWKTWYPIRQSIQTVQQGMASRGWKGMTAYASLRTYEILFMTLVKGA